MSKASLILIAPAQDSDRLGSRRRRKTSIPKLTLPLLAAYADARFDVRIIDETVEDIDFNIKADLVGITIMTQLAKRGYEIAREFRKRGSKVVMGGFHVFFFPEDAEQHADALLMGEGEDTWKCLLEDFLAGRLKKCYQVESYHDLTGLPNPRLDLLNKKAYACPNVIETARGCPHECSYCAVTKYWGYKFRFRPVSEVIEEIRIMSPGDIVFVDDNIVGSHRRAKELFSALIPLKRRWSGQADLKMANDPKLMEIAAKSGCKWMFMGIESINANNLLDVGKERVNSPERIEQSIAAIHEAGIKIFGSFIFGFDHDDKNVFEQTVQFCVDNHIEGANFYIFTPMPFTELYKQMELDGRILHNDWSKYDMNHVVFKPAKMTPDELLDGYLSAYRSFYSLGSIAKRVLRPNRDFGEVLALNLGRKMNYRYFEEGCLY